MAGVVRLLQYAIGVPPEEWPEGVESDDETETRPWHNFLIEMLIAVCPAWPCNHERVFEASLRGRELLANVEVDPLFLRR